MDSHRLTLILAASLTVACSKPSPPVEQVVRQPIDSAPAFVNKVWKVSRSNGVEPGQIYVFLSDGTMLIASSHGTPSLGRWMFGGDTLTLVEEGIPHHAHVVKSGGGELSIRFAEHGAPLDITLIPAAQAESVPDSLWGTSWVLEDIGGTGVIDDARATLEFPEKGKAAGRGSCNRFFASVEITGDSIAFGPVGSTRMACAEAIMNQEGKYLAALQDAKRFGLEGSALFIHTKATDKALRFTRQSP